MELFALLPNVRKLKWRDFEAEFDQKLIQAREGLDLDQKGGHADLTGGKALDVAGNKYAQLASISPRSAILESWRSVELAAYHAAARISSEALDPRMTSAKIAKFLSENKLLGGNEDMVFALLRDLRNKAAHATNFELSSQEAMEFVLLANRLKASLEQGSRYPEHVDGD